MCHVGGHLGQGENEDQVEEQLQRSDRGLLGSLPDLQPTYLHRPIVPMTRRLSRRSRLVAVQGLIGDQEGPVFPNFSSSFANSGVGLLSGAPGWIGRDSQLACSAA